MNPNITTTTRRRFLKSSGTLTATTMLFGFGRKSAIAVTPTPGSGSGQLWVAVKWEATIPAGTVVDTFVGPLPNKTIAETLDLFLAGNPAAVTHVTGSTTTKMSDPKHNYGLGTNVQVLLKEQQPFTIVDYEYGPLAIGYNMTFAIGGGQIRVRATIPAATKVTKTAVLGD